MNAEQFRAIRKANAEHTITKVEFAEGVTAVWAEYSVGFPTEHKTEDAARRRIAAYRKQRPDLVRFEVENYGDRWNPCWMVTGFRPNTEQEQREWFDAALTAHRSYVEGALRQGKDIPATVRYEYPDLCPLTDDEHTELYLDRVCGVAPY